MPEDTVVKLVPAVKAETDKTIVQWLEEYLEDAKNGDLTGMAIAVIRRDGENSTAARATSKADHQRLGYAMFRLASRMATDT